MNSAIEQHRAARAFAEEGEHEAAEILLREIVASYPDYEPAHQDLTKARF